MNSKSTGGPRAKIFISTIVVAPANAQVQALTKELIATQPDVIFALSRPVTAALQKETTTIPIVFTASALRDLLYLVQEPLCRTVEVRNFSFSSYCSRIDRMRFTLVGVIPAAIFCGMIYAALR